MKRILCITLILCFVLSLAACGQAQERGGGYSEGYNAGFAAGYERGKEDAKAEEVEKTYIKNNNTKKFHDPDCDGLKDANKEKLRRSILYKTRII